MSHRCDLILSWTTGPVAEFAGKFADQFERVGHFVNPYVGPLNAAFRNCQRLEMDELTLHWDFHLNTVFSLIFCFGRILRHSHTIEIARCQRGMEL